MLHPALGIDYDVS